MHEVLGVQAHLTPQILLMTQPWPATGIAPLLCIVVSFTTSLSVAADQGVSRDEVCPTPPFSIDSASGKVLLQRTPRPPASTASDSRSHTEMSKAALGGPALRLDQAAGSVRQSPSVQEAGMSQVAVRARKAFAGMNEASSMVLLSLVLTLCFVIVAGVGYAAGNSEFGNRLLKGIGSSEERGAHAGQANDAMQIPLALTDDVHFCPELVVPDGNVCILLMPAKPQRGETYDVIDSDGGVVLRVADAETGGGARALMTTWGDVLGQCRRARASKPADMQSAMHFELLDAKQTIWAKLSYHARQGADDKCVIETKTNQKLMLIGSIQHNALNLTDSHGELLATTGPATHMPEGRTPGTLFQVRVAPASDVGLVLCSLICLQQLSALL